jgi:hypothetical protein
MEASDESQDADARRTFTVTIPEEGVEHVPPTREASHAEVNRINELRRRHNERFPFFTVAGEVLAKQPVLTRLLASAGPLTGLRR